ncbi:MAG: hypothetical protein HPY51_14500 [Candidatus Omnitrophica bacterium]|nr:hypothetical protein [Candidatus Omnitrophota bacterium]
MLSLTNKHLCLACKHLCLAWIGLMAFCGAGGFISPAWPSDAGTLRVGYADLDITPELGHTMPGYFEERRATGVLDPLRAKALVLTQGGTTLAIVALDLISIEKPIADEIRGAVSQKTGIPTERIFLHATHTHTGATVSEIKDQLPGQVTEVVQQALEKRVEEFQVTLGTCEEHRIAFIRRYLMKDGTVRTNPGRGNPNIVRPIGKIDPTVYAITFSQAKTILASYGLHLDCIGGTQYSADYPYHMTEAVKKELGGDWNVIYLNACCGNVNHININNPNQRSGYEESRSIGQRLAESVLWAHRNGMAIPVDTIGAKAESVPTPARRIPEDLLKWAQEQMAADPTAASQRQFNEETPSRIIELAQVQDTLRTAEIIALRVGPVGIVGLPAETFVEVGQDIKIHSPFDPTLVIGLTGGSMGYLPHPRGYDEGGYEGTIASARNARETGILWSDTAFRLLRELLSGE